VSALDRVNEDVVELTVDNRKLLIAESYQVKRSVFEQPSAFELKLGSKQDLTDIARDVKVGMEFGLSVATDANSGSPVQIMSGRIDAIDVSDAQGTIIAIRGRDPLAPLLRAAVRADESFSESSYADLTRRVMDKLHMLEKNILVVGNLANRKAITGVDTLIENAGESEFRDDLIALDPNPEVRYGHTETMTVRRVRRTIKAHLGESWYSFLKRQYKKAGLFLWCAGEGSFVLAPPTLGQAPIARIYRDNPLGDRWLTTADTQVKARQLSIDYTNRHARVRVWGKAGKKMGGRSKFSSHVDDMEMIERGYDPEVFIEEVHDVDVRSNKEAEYVARRYLAEERRDSWRLSYTISGHSTPSLLKAGNCVWAPDTMVRVDDYELGYVDKHFYVTDVVFNRGESGTFTTIELARPEDMVFAEKEQAA
jgi:prophage tail gpP-like protein